MSCVSWAGFPTLQDKYDAADLVVVASSAARDGTAPVFGADAHAYDVRVDDVLKGDLDEPRVRISAMPDPCSGRAEYPEGDPLDTSEPLLVFATVQDGEWFTLTPTDGTAPFTKDALDSVVR
ncbi:hypothetical protein [uncultured Arthrobacter sp.]|uniref:hypothetical protein n=1 Tax=uncultured Arthrobacter sp. TaxID=114050 RepID=UPI002636B3E0|nr:hypothetical protein [uncultured Arthrobacter sp.]